MHFDKLLRDITTTALVTDHYVQTYYDLPVGNVAKPQDIIYGSAWFSDNQKL